MAYDKVINSKMGGAILKKPRSSNLELYRIICMLLIVAHHFVVNSGVAKDGGPISLNPESFNSLFLTVFGAWGKTGINCFLMITGYFMCTSSISLRKFLKLMLQIYFYNIVIYCIFLISGHEVLSMRHLINVFVPFWGLSSGFVSCFIVFYLTIPFWNILIRNMNKKEHGLLLILLLTCYTLFGSIPTFEITFNYITWFGVIYLIASYIRLYPQPLFSRRPLWGLLTVSLVALAIVSIVVLMKMHHSAYLLVSDCNKLFAVAIATTSFLWFKNMDIKYNKLINAFGAASFGVLLIHANSAAMRSWLWEDIVNVVGHYSMPPINLVLFCLGTVLTIFIVCNLIDQLRIATFEKWFFNWYDSRFAR